MADLVFGLAKSAVKETVSIAKSAIEEEKKLQKGVQRDLMLISDEFEMMHSFLSVAKERVADDMMVTCMRQVREMALDVEDCIDSILHLDNKSSWWRHMLPSCMSVAAPAVALNDAVAGIELLKARVEAIGQRNLRYSHITDSSSKPTKQMHQQGEIHTTASNILLTSTTAREAAKEQICQVELMELISAEGADVLRVISVLGTVGMASVINRAYDDPEICKNFRCRAWVKLMHPFNPREFIRSLVAQFCRSYSPQESTTVDFVVEMMAATEEVLIKEFMKQMRFQKYLVVLEGIITMDDWEASRVYLPDSNNGSRIIVSTHQFEIGSLCVGHPHRVLELEKLSSDHSVYALVKEDMIGQVEHQTVGPDTSCEYPLVGREMDVYCLSELVDSTGVYSVWGMSAVGKSSLVKNFYCERQAELKNNPGLTRGSLLMYGWVNVSRPFDLMDLSWSLLLDLDPGFIQTCRMSTMRDPIQECRQYLRMRNCFVVIDGLQSTKEWDLIKAALELETTRRHVILIITNEESIAKYCATTIELVYNVKGLQVDDTFKLLKQICHREGIAQIEDEALHILHKFGGLPKIIRTAADRMYRRDLLSDLLGKDNNLVSMLEADRRLDDLFAWLVSYFHSCPDFLRPCIFYLPIFPLNHAIRRRRLVRRWIAEAYSRETKEYTAEENGEIFFTRLTNLSMIHVRAGTTSRTSHVDNSKKIPLCQVNCFLREYIISQSMEENLVFTLDSHCRKNLQRTERHLAIDKSWERDQNMFERVDFSRLRSLTVFGEWKRFFVSEKMRLLRVLDLEDVSSGVTIGDIEQMVKMLPHLKFLSLRSCREISQLPDSIGNLKHLQTLDIRETSVTKLPKSIINLEKLQYIRAGTTTHHQATEAADKNPAQSVASMRRPYAATLVSCLSKLCRHDRLNGGGSYHSGVKVPRGIGRLFDMHTLGVADIEAAGGDAEELKKLTQLRKLGISGVNRNHIQKFFTAISDLAHLESLSLGLQLNDDDEASCLDDIISPPVNLRSLKLYGLVRKFPVWIKKLEKLRKLSLQMTMLPQEGIDDLASNLPELENIRLFLSEFRADELHFGIGRQEIIFLGLLEISCNSRVQAKITFHDHFYLKVLRIRCWHMSSLQFSGLDSLKALEEVWLSSPYDDSLKQHLESELAKRNPKEIVKPVLRLQQQGSWIPWLLTSS